MKKQTLRMVIGIILIAVGITGCGKTEKDEIAESLNDLQETASGTDGGQASADEAVVDGGIPEHLSYSVTAEGGAITNVEADVISVGFENAPIYEADVKVIDEELIAEYADILFSNGKYEVIKPYSMFSLQELKDERKFIASQIDSYKGMKNGCERLYSEADRIDSYIWNYEESNVSELADGQLIYEEDMTYKKVHSSFSSEEEEVTYSSARLRGMVDGEQWELFYEAINGSEAQQSINIFSCERVIPDNIIVNMDDEAVEEYGENLSNLESSQKSAEDMLDKFGYENMEVIHTGQIVHDNYNTPWTDGYKFVFARSVGTMQIGYKDNSIEMLGDFDNDFKFGVQQEYIHVYVIDNSAYRLTIDNIVEIGDVLSEGEQSSLMSFEKIDSIARELMEQDMKNWSANGLLNIDRVCLKYSVLPFEDGRYALMPVWLYYTEKSDNVWLCINAGDGSSIFSFYPNKSLLN